MPSSSLEHGSVESGNQCLKHLSMVRADAKTGPPQDEMRISNVFTFSVSALVLAESGFFKIFDGQQQTIPSPKVIRILQLRRHLWRLAGYYKDAWTFVRTAFPIFRRILKPDGTRGLEVKIVWIGDQPDLLPPHPDTNMVKQSPETFLNGLFMEFAAE